MVLEDRGVKQDLKVSQVRQVLLVRRDPRVILVPRVHKVPKAQWDLRVKEVQTVWRGRKVLQDRKVKPGLPVR